MENVCRQEDTVRENIRSLLDAGRHDSVIPWMNAFVSRTFKNEGLKEFAIEWAFCEGAGDGIMKIVEEFHVNPSITPDNYATGLIRSWNWDESEMAFPFLLSHADMDDLKEAEGCWLHEDVPRFRRIIDKALKTVPPGGTRRNRFLERVKQAIITLQYAVNDKVLKEELGDIIESHLAYGQEWMKEMSEQ